MEFGARSTRGHDPLQLGAGAPVTHHDGFDTAHLKDSAGYARKLFTMREPLWFTIRKITKPAPKASSRKVENSMEHNTKRNDLTRITKLEMNPSK
jgi:hypothetical protein